MLLSSGAENGALLRGAGRGRPADLLGSFAPPEQASGGAPPFRPNWESLSGAGCGVTSDASPVRFIAITRRNYIDKASGKENLGGDALAGDDVARKTVAVTLAEQPPAGEKA